MDKGKLKQENQTEKKRDFETFQKPEISEKAGNE